MLVVLLVIGCSENVGEPAQTQTQSADIKDLISAIYKGDRTRAEQAIEQGAEINGRCKLGWTPLMHAAFSGDLAMVKMLVAAGATIDDEAIRAAGDRGNEAVIDYLKAQRQP
jgi:ankyrin repeat protein